MSVDALKEIDDFFRSMRQACNSRDMKAYRSHFWTDKRFLHVDASGQVTEGWGAYEESIDQDFRYLDTIRMELKDLKYHVFDEQFAIAAGAYSLTQVDPGGREVTQEGLVSFSVSRMRDDWKIVGQHYAQLQNGGM